MTPPPISYGLPTMTKDRMPPLLFRLWDEPRMTMSPHNDAVISGHDNRQWQYAGEKFNKMPSSVLLKDMIYYGNSRLSEVTENFGQAESMFYAFSKDLHSIIYLETHEHRYAKPLLFLMDGRAALEHSGCSFVKDSDALAKFPAEALKYWEESQAKFPGGQLRFDRYISNNLQTFIKEVDVYGKLSCKFYVIFDWYSLRTDLVKNDFLEGDQVEGNTEKGTLGFIPADPLGQYNVGLLRHNIWSKACAVSTVNPVMAAETVGMALYKIFRKHQVNRYPTATFDTHYERLFVEWAAREIRNYRTFETLTRIRINGKELSRMGLSNHIVDGEPGHTEAYITNIDLDFHHPEKTISVQTFEVQVFCPSGKPIKARLVVPDVYQKLHKLDYAGKANEYLKPIGNPQSFVLPAGKFTFKAWIDQGIAAFTHELHVTIDSVPQEVAVGRTLAAHKSK